MSNLPLHSSENLRKALHGLPAGMPITTAQCEQQWGVSRQLAHWYTKSGWLDSLGHGYYIRHGETPTLTGAVAALESAGFKVHIGGKSALDQRGYSHYLQLGGGKIYLYGRGIRKLPQWLSSYFTVELSTAKLFHESEEVRQRLFVRQLEPQSDYSPCVSDPERALLEMLDNVPGVQTLQESREIMESMYSLNPGKLELLLQACTKIKVKRLFWNLCQDLDLPFLGEIDYSKIDFGSETSYIIRGEKTMVIKKPAKDKNGN